MEADFSGYATKAGLKCSDGRTITPDAFKHQDKMEVPLVWQHGHSDANNVLGKVLLEARDDGVYAHGYFNDTPQGQNGRKIVQHGDVKYLSIFANELFEKTIAGAKQVLHGAIREVSLVLAGANPGAVIDYVSIAHSDGDVVVHEDEAVITTGIELEHGAALSGEEEDESFEHAASDPTLQDVYDSMTQEQKDVVAIMIGMAIDNAGGSATHSALAEDAEPQEIYDSMSPQEKEVVHSMLVAAVEEAKTVAVAEHSALTNQEEGSTVNVFETQKQQSDANSLKHAAMMDARSKLDPNKIQSIFADAGKYNGSVRESFIAHAAEYGIENIDLLFPDAVLDGNGITTIARRTEWVANVLGNTKHSPMSRIKSLSADLTAEEARAKGYVKGTMKKDEVIKLLRRITTPKTIYKKQKLDRDDILDITDLDIVVWLKAEMRVMLDEEIARAILVSDGREIDDDDKINEENLRPVAYDVDMYNTKVDLPASFTPTEFIDAVVTARKDYKGTGSPTLYTTTDVVTPLILSKDDLGRRLYGTEQELAAALRVKEIVEVEAMEQDSDLVAVLVNLQDYTVGADNGGNVAMFEDFDIDFNQEKFLLETRISGALTKPKSAVTFRKNSGRIVTPTTPTFVTSTGVLTVPTQTGTVYVNADTGTTLAPGAQTAIAPGATINVEAVPAAGYGFTHDSDNDWSFTRDAS